MLIKVSEATKQQLDWLVATATEPFPQYLSDIVLRDVERGDDFKIYSPSTNWGYGGPIIEREVIRTNSYNLGKTWLADGPRVNDDIVTFEGPTPLIAAMRCFVASKLGNEVDIPEELT